MTIATISLGSSPYDEHQNNSVLTYHSSLDKEVKGCFMLGDPDPDVPIQSIMLNRKELKQLRDWCSRIIDLDSNRLGIPT